MAIGLGILTFGTLIATALFGFLSARATDERRRSGAAKSSLAADYRIPAE